MGNGGYLLFPAFDVNKESKEINSAILPRCGLS